MRRKGGKRNKGNIHNQTQVCDLSAQSVRTGLFCEKGQWLFYNENNLFMHRAFHGVGAGLNGVGSARQRWGVCCTRTAPGGGQQGNLLLRKSDCAQETGEQRIIYIRGSTAPSSTTSSNWQFREEARESPLFHKQITGSKMKHLARRGSVNSPGIPLALAFICLQS